MTKPTEPNPAEEHLALSRSGGRREDQMRPVTLTRGVLPHALGSCEVAFGETRVLCAASIEPGVPGWRAHDHAGWVTAEYAMLPCSTTTRSRRERATRKGRSMEIERLVGRSLRAVCNLKALGEYTVTVDCDVVNADGGTRTASVTGAWVALHDALMAYVDAKKIARLPLTDQVVAVSVGMVSGRVVCDLDYAEDSSAEVDMNLVVTGSHEFVEVQGTGERTPFSREKLGELLDVAGPSVDALLRAQDECVGWSD
ncbi:MAG: ribonuclease PH [Coriobacteriales bacterium]|jgi:ribonuclease PH